MALFIRPQIPTLISSSCRPDLVPQLVQLVHDTPKTNILKFEKYTASDRTTRRSHWGGAGRAGLPGQCGHYFRFWCNFYILIRSRRVVRHLSGHS